MALWHIEYLKLKELVWENSRSRKVTPITFLHSSPETGHKLSCERCPDGLQRKAFLSPKTRGHWEESKQTVLAKFPQYITLMSHLSPVIFLYDCLLVIKPNTKILKFSHFFSFPISSRYMEEKVFLNPLRISSCVWKLYWQKHINRSKAYKLI